MAVNKDINNIDEVEVPTQETAKPKFTGLSDYAKELKEGDKTEETGDYLAMKAEIGFKRGLGTMRYLGMTSVGATTGGDENARLIAEDRAELKQLNDTVDDFYIQNKDTLYGVPYVAGSLVENITNPVETFLNVATGVATGGSSLVYSVGSQIVMDAWATRMGTVAETGEEPSMLEYGVGMVGSALPDIAGHYIGKAIRGKGIVPDVDVPIKADVDVEVPRTALNGTADTIAEMKTNMTNNVEAGDLNVNIREVKEAMDDAGVYDGATKGAYQAQNKVNYGTDQADVKARPIASDDVLVETPTFLQRRNAIAQEELAEDLDFDLLNYDRLDKEGREGLLHKYESLEAIQKAIKEQNEKIRKSDYVLGKDVQNVLQEVIVNAKDELRKSEVSKSWRTEVRLQNVEDIMKKHHLNYEKQKVLVANEYSNLLGQKPQEFLEDIGYDSETVNLARNYVYNDYENMTHKQKEFMLNVDKDNSILRGDSREQIPDVDAYTRLLDRIKRAGLDDMKGARLLKAVPNEPIPAKVLASKDFHTILSTNGFDATLSKKAGVYIRADIKPSILKTEHMVNKQVILMDNHKYFKTQLNEPRQEIVGKSLKPIEVAKNMEGELLEHINKFKDLFKDSDKMTKEKLIETYFNVIHGVNMSVDNAKGTSYYRSFHDIGQYFKDDKSLTSFFFDHNPTSIKSNANMMRFIFEEQPRNISMIDTYGTSSVGRIKHKAREVISLTELQKQGIPSSKRVQMYKDISAKFDLALDNVFNPRRDVDAMTSHKLQSAIRTQLTRATMYGRGAAEFITNPVVAAMRGAKYGQNPISSFSYGAWRTIKGIGKLAPAGAMPNGKYVIAGLAQEQTVYATAKETASGVLSRVDRFGYKINEMSDRNLNRYGEIYATSIIDKLDANYNNIDNEVKRVLSVNGVNEKNFKTFHAFAKKHISGNGNYIDSNTLLNSTGDRSADQLRGVFNFISDEVGNVKSNSILQNQFKSEINKWLGMYRGFSRSLFGDVLDDAMYYTTREGLRKTRLSTGGLKSTAKEWNNIATIAGMGFVAGYSEDVVKSLIYGNRDWSEKVALSKTKLIDNVADKYQGNKDTWYENLGSQAWTLTKDLFNANRKMLGLDLGFLEAQVPLVAPIKKMVRTYKDEDMTAPEKASDYTYIIAHELVAKAYLEWIEGTYKTSKGYTTGIWDDDTKKIYDFTSDENANYFANVFNIRNIGAQVEGIEKKVDSDVLLASAQADYLDDSTKTYESLPKEDKELFDTSMKMQGVDNATKETIKPDYALLIANTNSESLNLGKEVAMSNAEENMRELTGVTFSDIDVYKEQIKAHSENVASEKDEKAPVESDVTSNIPAEEKAAVEPLRASKEKAKDKAIDKTEFDSLTPKKRKYYDNLMKFTNQGDTQENREAFIRNFKNKGSKDIDMILKRRYNVDMVKFEKTF